MNVPARRRRWSLAARLALAVAGFGGVCIVASMLIAYLIADHSSSDSSPSSLLAIGLGSLGFLSVVLGTVLFIGAALARLFHGSGPAKSARGDSR